MGDQSKNDEKNLPAGLDDSTIEAVRKAKKNVLNQEMLAKLARELKQQRQRARRYKTDIEILEANGTPGRGAKIIDLSMNGARLELPFSPPFMSQLIFKFGLAESEKVFQVVGRVIRSKMTMKKGWYDVGVQFYQNYWELDQLLRLEQR